MEQLIPTGEIWERLCLGAFDWSLKMIRILTLRKICGGGGSFSYFFIWVNCVTCVL